MPLTPKRPRSTLLTILALWAIFYASFTLFTPPLLDDADSVHAEVAREMLLRHDYVTLYANGIRYLEKAPLLYWSIAASFRLFGVSTAAARIPLALTILALALITEAFARRAFRSTRAGLYAALILLSSPGLFLYTRITLPDAMVCLWLTLALYSFWLMESPTRGLYLARENPFPLPGSRPPQPAPIVPCLTFAAACALNVLTKGLIGIVFPITIVFFYVFLTYGPRNTLSHLRRRHPLPSLAVFLAIAAPWHILIAIANPTQGHPGNLTFSHGHFAVPLPTNGNVHGWLWFYFINEQLLRYLNLRIPRDYDTVPLYLFWGLILIWLMPWSAFLFVSFRKLGFRVRRGPLLPNPQTFSVAFQKFADSHKPTFANSGLTLAPLDYPWFLLCLWAAAVLLFFLFSTRQEYYVLPAFPALAILLARWFSRDGQPPNWPLDQPITRQRRANLRITAILLTLGTLFALSTVYFLLHTHTPSPTTDLAQLLQQNPSDYALSMGHFLDLNANALGLFRLPLALAAAGLFLGPLASYILRRKAHPHAATLTLAAGSFTFLLAVHLALQTFAPVLTSQQLAAAIAPQLQGRAGEPPALIIIHQEYEFASTLGFYLKRNDLHILEGRSSNLWYGSFFPDAPEIFETPETLAARWPNPQRIFLWQDLANQPSPLPPLPDPIYVIAKSGGKEIVSNQPNHP